MACRLFQLTAARRRLAEQRRKLRADVSFNSQPPEGGWVRGLRAWYLRCGFQLTAARRRLDVTIFEQIEAWAVSTHSRPKAAGFVLPAAWLL